MGCLRPEWEPDNFCRSHRCTSSVRLWSGARSVLITPARPAVSFASFPSLRATAFAPKVLGLVLSELSYVFFGPNAYCLHVQEGLNRGRFHPFLSNPPVERIATYPDEPRNLNGRINFLLQESHTPITFVKRENMAGFVCCPEIGSGTS
jgi:hypothetical protein